MNTNPTDTAEPPPRIRPDDKLINLVPEVSAILGDPAVSTMYNDPELMAMRVYMSPPGSRQASRMKFIEREILELRAKRVAESAPDPEAVKAHIEKQIERRRSRQRKTNAA